MNVVQSEGIWAMSSENSKFSFSIFFVALSLKKIED